MKFINEILNFLYILYNIIFYLASKIIRIELLGNGHKILLAYNALIYSNNFTMEVCFGLEPKKKGYNSFILPIKLTDLI